MDAFRWTIISFIVFFLSCFAVYVLARLAGIGWYRSRVETLRTFKKQKEDRNGQ